MTEPLLDLRGLLGGLSGASGRGQIDVVQQIPGLPDWPTLVEQAEVYELDGDPVRVMNRATLIELKRRRRSAQDLADIEAIQLLDEI